MLVAVIVMVALVLVALSVAAPVIAKDLRRDKELESEHRAQQYVRAIRLYYRKLHSYPPSIDALKQSNNIRFLRQEYTDPLTGKADWRLIHQGEQKTTVKGFFGQELGGIASSGLGSAAGMASGMGSPVAGSMGASTIGATSPLAGGFSGATIGSATPGNATPPLGLGGATGSTGSSGLGGGGPIVGVGPAATGSSILTPNAQKTYETWEFWYDPRIEQMYQKGHQNGGVGSNGMGTQPASGFGTPGATPGLGSGAPGTSPSSNPTGSTGPSSIGSGVSTVPQ